MALWQRARHAVNAGRGRKKRPDVPSGDGCHQEPPRGGDTGEFFMVNVVVDVFGAVVVFSDLLVVLFTVLLLPFVRSVRVWCLVHWVFEREARFLYCYCSCSCSCSRMTAENTGVMKKELFCRRLLSCHGWNEYECHVAAACLQKDELQARDLRAWCPLMHSAWSGSAEVFRAVVVAIEDNLGRDQVRFSLFDLLDS